MSFLTNVLAVCNRIEERGFHHDSVQIEADEIPEVRAMIADYWRLYDAEKQAQEERNAKAEERARSQEGHER